MELDTPDVVPTLVTGVTSRSLLDLADLAIPLDATEDDALLGVRIDREVRDLVHRLLLAVGATPGELPEDLDSRLSGPDTAHLVAPARALLARRGGTLADPRMTAAAASGADVRIVDPGDLAPVDIPEATGWEGLAGDGEDAPDLVRVARTVDSLVREVELDAARPLLRTIRQARATDASRPRHEDEAATAPLQVVDELWERAVEADRDLTEQRATVEALEGRLAETEAERDELRARTGLRAAWRVLTGRRG